MHVHIVKLFPSGVFLARKSHLVATFFFTNTLRKNSYIGKKCRSEVQKFTPTKISGGFIISGGGGISTGYMSGRNTASSRGIILVFSSLIAVTKFQWEHRGGNI